MEDIKSSSELYISYFFIIFYFQSFEILKYMFLGLNPTFVGETVAFGYQKNTQVEKISSTNERLIFAPVLPTNNDEEQ